MNNQKIYAVQDLHWDELDCVHAIFDSAEKAENFLTRFKTRQDLRVIELVLNPDYISDKMQDPYRVELPGTRTVSSNVSICTYIDEAEEALAETFFVDVCASEDIENADFSVKVFGQTQEEAVSKAIKIRDEAIARGEWHKAHLKVLKAIKESEAH